MFRVLAFLVGSAVLFALLAGVYYAPENTQHRTVGVPAFNLAPGEVRQDGLQPALPDSAISVEILVLQGTVDIYVMDKEWAAGLTRDGALLLDAPFSYDADSSATHVNHSHVFTLISDGITWKSMVFDNSDNHYDGDAVPGNGTEPARLKVTVRYVDEEERSLVLGYIAVVPSILLVGVTFGRKWLRHRAAQKEI